MQFMHTSRDLGGLQIDDPYRCYLMLSISACAMLSLRQWKKERAATDNEQISGPAYRTCWQTATIPLKRVQKTLFARCWDQFSAQSQFQILCASAAGNIRMGADCLTSASRGNTPERHGMFRIQVQNAKGENCEVWVSVHDSLAVVTSLAESFCT